MIDYGAPPAPDEIEITLFGPGYGEAVAVHLGAGCWMLVDSCIDPDSKSSAAINYHEKIGVDASQVRTIVASHWHDDHVKGISQLSAKYPAADFVLSGVFSKQEAAAFAAAYNGRSSNGLSRGMTELFSVVQSRSVVNPALHKSVILQETLNSRNVMVTSLSPLPAAFAASLTRMSLLSAKKDEAINHAPELHPNMEAVVLHIDLGDDAVLLGSDLEEHATYGWSAVVNDPWCSGRRPSTAYKVAHHGSYTGDCPKIWSKLLRPEPVACLTPFTRGNVKLPTDDDKSRVKGNTKYAYVSSVASRRPDMESRQLKRLSDICKNLTKVDAGFGAVRLRKTIGGASWGVELFGAAQSL